MFQGFYGLLTVMLCVLFAIVVVLFNIAPITYIVFSIAILLSVFLQYRRFKKHSISESAHSRLACGLFIVITLSIYWLVVDWVKYDLNTTVDQFEDFKYSTTDWKRGWPNNSELPEGLKSPEQLSEGIDKVSMVRTDVAWATAHPNSYHIIDSIEEESLNLPKRSFIEWLRFSSSATSSEVAEWLTEIGY